MKRYNFTPRKVSPSKNKKKPSFSQLSSSPKILTTSRSPLGPPPKICATTMLHPKKKILTTTASQKRYNFRWARPPPPPGPSEVVPFSGRCSCKAFFFGQGLCGTLQIKALYAANSNFDRNRLLLIMETMEPEAFVPRLGHG